MIRTLLASAAITGALAASGVASAGTYALDITTIHGTVLDLSITTGNADFGIDAGI